MDDYCELCDLPLSQCIHGMPAPPPEPPKAAPKPRKAPATRVRSVKAAAPARASRWTQPEVLKPHILAVLEAAGGELDADDLFTGLEEALGDQLRDADRERTPEGELRWQLAARRARVELIRDGAMTKSRPGVWQLG